MRKIAVVTGTRAEYGLLKNIMREIEHDDSLQLELVVTGTHLSQNYGYTLDEIIKDGFQIKEKINILMESNSSDCIAKEMGLAMIEFSSAFNRIKPDILLVLGDRYEIFAAVSTAMSMNIPIAHISGGEITEGAIDEQIRHAITKMAHIHFPGAEVYANNIINMGEEKWRVFNVGDSGIENIKLTNLLTKEELMKSIGVEVDNDTFLITYHPVTLEIDNVDEQISNIIEALKYFDKKKFIITYPNADNGGKKIIEKLEELNKEHKNVYLYKNLGSLNYLSVMNLCETVIGNSSSALIEAPFVKKPVVNIGNRQSGRLKATNILDCGYETDDIISAINKATSKEFEKIVKDTKSLYGEGNTSKEIIRVLKNITLGEKILKKKLTWS